MGELPNGLAGGRYRVDRLLGEGSKKRVLLAHDTHLDRPVALSILRTDGLDPLAIEHLQDEARAMARIPTHPHVVTLFDMGEHDGALYLSTEYAPGGELRDRLERTPTHRLSTGETLRLASQICEALAHAHAAGVVHRDLNPGNVWLTETGDAKVGDFGLAVSLARSRAVRDGQLVTAVAYMSPEVALGQPPDPRTDLYALGAMLYEMITGRPPFLGDDAVAVLSQHIHTQPLPPSQFEPGVPAALEALVLQLLAKLPAQRPAGAADVREVLTAIGTGAAAPGAIGNPLDRLAHGAFVGREPLMIELRTVVEQMLAGHGTAVFFTGDPGIGKTRSADELSTYARLRGAVATVGRCHEGEGAPAYWPWKQALRLRIEAMDPDHLLARLGTARQVLVPLLPELDGPGTSPPPALDASQSRFRLFDAVVHLLRVLTADAPLVLTLDDLHRADDASAELLTFVAREIGSLRILLIGTLRDAEVPPEHALANVGRSGRVVPLAGLAQDDVARLIEVVTGDASLRPLARNLHERTGGNPLFVTETVRLLATTGQLRETVPERLPIPPTVRAVIRDRLERLPPTARDVLTTAAVLGRDFDPAVLAPTCDLAPATLLSALDEAATARLIEPTGSRPGLYRFVHVLVRDALYEQLPLAERLRRHARAGETLAGVAATPPAVLAHHFGLAAQLGDPSRAIEYALAAGHASVAEHAYADAAKSFEAAEAWLALDPERLDDRIDALLALGEACTFAGERERARASYRTAGALARARDDSRRFALAADGFAGRGEVTAGVDPEVVRMLEEALAMIETRHDEHRRVSLLSRLAGAVVFEEGDRADRLSAEAVALAERTGDTDGLMRALFARYMVLWAPEHIEERLAVTERLQSLVARSTAPDHPLIARLFRLATLLEIGDIEAVDAGIAEYARALDEIDLPFYRWQLISMRAMRAAMQGRFAETEDLATQGLALGERLQSPNAMLRYLVHIYPMRRAQGRAAELEPLLAAAVENSPELSGLRAALAALSVDLDRLGDARRHFDRLAAAGFAAMPHDLTWSSTMAYLAEVCFALGDAERAGPLFDLLAPHRDRIVVITFAHGCEGAVARPLALLAATQQRWDEADALFTQAAELNQRLGAIPQRGHTLRDWAWSFARRGDAARARTLYAEAGAAYRAVGMTHHADRAERDASAITEPGGAAPTPVTTGNLLERHERRWRVVFDGRETLVRNLKGMHYLAQLLAHPDRETHVFELYAAVDAPGEAARQSTLRPAGPVADPVLDAQAMAAYRQRLLDLRDEIEEAEGLGDIGRVEHARNEVGVIEEELGRIVGFGGRPRRQSDAVERARKAIYNRLQSTINAIDEVLPDLGRHLTASVRTGTFCVYRPERPTEWVVS